MTDAMPAALQTLLPAGLSAPDYLWMGALILAGACLQGVGGIGFAMLCAPLGAIFSRSWCRGRCWRWVAACR